MFCGNMLNAQNFPEKKYEKREQFEFNNQINGWAIGLSSANTKFLNSNFSENVETGKLNPKFGMNVKLQYTTKPIFFDINYFSSNFKPSDEITTLVKDIPTDSLAYRHRGVDFYVSLKICPSNRFLFKNLLLPYLGVGYQFSELALTKDSFFQKSLSGSFLNSHMWKAGLNLTFSPVLIFYGEYKSTNNLFVDEKNRFYQFNFGILIKLSYKNN